jgi:type IV secretion system protein VirD4
MSSPSAGIYHIPTAQKDITRFIWVGLGLFIVIALLSSWAATEYAAWALGFTAALGKPMLPYVYFPFDILVWTWKYNRPEYGAAVLTIFERAHLAMGIGGFFSLVLPVGLAYRRSRKADGERNDLHGSAHWARPEEVAAAGLLPNDKNKGGVLFGAWEENGQVRYLRHKGPEHMMVFAPTRSGKGVGVVIPTLLSWDQSVLVNDIKGENWHLTSGFREKILGQRCIRYAPAEQGSARFNPLNEIRMDGNLIKDVQNIATMIVDPEGKGLNDHWAKTGFDLLVGVVLFVLLDARIKNKTLTGVAAVLSDGGEIKGIADEIMEASQQGGKDAIEGGQAIMQVIATAANEKLKAGRFDKPAEEHGWRVAAQAAQAMMNKAPNEFSGVLSTSLSFLTLYRDPIIAESTSVSDFTLEDLMGGRVQSVDGEPRVAGPKVALYIVSPPSDKDRIKPLTRLLLNQVIRRLTEGMEFEADGSGRSIYHHRLLLLIDEFPSLGKLEVFQEALAFIAGYGLKALLIVQDLSQLVAAYTKDESITSNCHIRVAYAPNKIETAELLSKMAGQATVTHTQRQYSGNRLAVLLQNVNTNEQIVQRPLLTPDECMRIPPDDELVFVAGHAPVYCQKIKYYQDAALAERIKLGPASATGRAN